MLAVRVHQLFSRAWRLHVGETLRLEPTAYPRDRVPDDADYRGARSRGAAACESAGK